jgi:hypothetical protein
VTSFDSKIMMTVVKFVLAALLAILLMPGCGSDDEVLGPGDEITCADVTSDSDSVHVVISMSRLDSVLVFCQQHVPENALEYQWAVFVDLDSNSTTGIYGWDLVVALSSFKSNSRADTLSVLEGTQHNTWTAQQGSWTWRYEHKVNAYVLPGTYTVVMSGLKAWPELLNLDETDPMYFRTYYYSDGGVICDSTAVIEGENAVRDPAGDVPYPNMDIICGQVLDAVESP